MAAGDVDIIGDAMLSSGLRLVWGTVVLDGGNPTPVDLAALLASCEMGVASIQGSAAPGADPVQITVTVATTVLNIYAWKPTTAGAGGNADLIASTDNARIVNWMAVGPKKAGA